MIRSGSAGGESAPDDDLLSAESEMIRNGSAA
jgi:hypothetical protein